MIYILILTMTSYNHTGVATAEFDAYHMCEAAGVRWVKQTDPRANRKAKWLCVPKSDVNMRRSK